MPGRRVRAPYRQVNDFERGRIVGMREANMSYRQIALRVNRSVSVVQRIYREWSEEGQQTRRVGSGPRSRTTAREDRHLQRMAVTDRSASSSALARQWNEVTQRHVSAVTVRRRLLHFGLRAYRPLLRLPLTPQHRTTRRRWCLDRQHWQDEWHHVVFSDESRFCLFESDGRILVRRHIGERHREDCIRTRHTAPTRGVMVWGAISYESRSRLVRITGTITSARYIQEILEPIAIPYLQAIPDAIFQQDNARPHTAAPTMAFLNQNNVQLLPWPARSPDLSPIENVWDMVKRRVRQAQRQPTTADELWEQVNAAWMAVPQATIQNLFNSIPRRVQQVIHSRGGYTHY